MSGCGHEHGGGHSHSHNDDDHLKLEGQQDYLYGVIDTDSILASNEHEPVRTSVN